MPPAALTVADVFRRYGDAFRSQVGATLSTAQRRVMTAIEQCRTAALGGHVERCDQCGHRRVWYNSCRNRHCPTCQSLARAAWLERRRADLLPTEYFHVVFTVPPAIAAIAAQNQAVIYGLLFRAVAETLRTIAADPRHLGAEIGFFAVLHTWGQTLVHHPHLHCVIPGGGLAGDGARWVACRPGFFLPVRVLSRYFRRVLLAAVQDAFESGRPRSRNSATCCRQGVYQGALGCRGPFRMQFAQAVPGESTVGRHRVEQSGSTAATLKPLNAASAERHTATLLFAPSQR